MEFWHAVNGDSFIWARLISKPNCKSEATIDVHLWHFEIRVLDVSGIACNMVQLCYAVSFGFWGGDRFRGRTIRTRTLKPVYFLLLKEHFRNPNSFVCDLREWNTSIFGRPRYNIMKWIYLIMQIFSFHVLIPSNWKHKKYLSSVDNQDIFCSFKHIQ